MSDIIANQVQLWRQKVLDGTITKAEMTAAVEAIRKERVNASVKSAVSRAKRTPEVIDTSALLEGF